MKFRTLFNPAILLLIVSFTITQAQNTKVFSEKEKHAIQVMHTASEAFYDFYHNILNPSNISYNEAGSFYEQTFEIIPGVFGTLPYEVRSIKHFRLTKEGDNVTGGHTIINCNYLYFNFTWNGDKIESVTSGKRNWKIKYNSAGLVSEISDIQYIKPGPPYKDDKQWFKVFVSFEYNSASQITSVQKFKDVGIGKSVEKISPSFTYQLLKKIIRYDEPAKTWSIELTRFKDKLSEKEADQIENVSTVTRSMDKNKILISSLNTEAIVNEIGQVISVNITLSNAYKTSYSYEYNDRGWLKTCTTKNINNDGTFRSGISSTYDYQYKGGDVKEMCSYKAVEEQKQYNAAGEVIIETREGEIRKRNENGEWGPWQKGNYKLTAN